jgi:hypothetical protein
MSQGWHEDFEREHRLQLLRFGVQCDGCMRDLPLVDGVHYQGDKPHMVCTANLYRRQMSCGDTLAK